MKLVLKLPLCILGGNNRLNVCGNEVMSRNSVLLYEALFCFLPMRKYVQLNFLTLPVLHCPKWRVSTTCVKEIDHI